MWKLNFFSSKICFEIKKIPNLGIVNGVWRFCSDQWCPSYVFQISLAKDWWCYRNFQFFWICTKPRHRWLVTILDWLPNCGFCERPRRFIQIHFQTMPDSRHSRLDQWPYESLFEPMMASGLRFWVFAVTCSVFLIIFLPIPWQISANIPITTSDDLALSFGEC